MPPTRKYQAEGGPGMIDILNLLKSSDAPDRDIALFMRACILFWMLGATDGHAKNFSIALGPGGRFRLTPVYDVLTAQPSFDTGLIQRSKFKLAMSVGSNRHYAIGDIIPRHFMQTAKLAGIGEGLIRDCFEDIAGSIDRALETVVAALPPGVPAPLISSVAAALRDRSALGAGLSRG